jgi:hypothetical protein
VNLSLPSLNHLFLLYFRNVRSTGVTQIWCTVADIVRQGEKDGHHYRQTNAKEITAKLPSFVSSSWGKFFSEAASAPACSLEGLELKSWRGQFSDQKLFV